MELILSPEKSRSRWARLFYSLKVGENRVHLTLSKKYNISGDFILVKKAGDTFKIGKTFSDFKAGKLNTATNRSALLQAINAHAKAARWNETFKAVKVSSSDYNIVRHNITGIILYRTISAYCLAKWPDGHWTVQNFTFKQEYIGSSFKGAYKRYSNGSQSWVDGQ